MADAADSKSAVRKDVGVQVPSPAPTHNSTMETKEQAMPKATVRRGKLTIPFPDDLRERLDVHDGDELEVSAEDGRIVLTPVAERHPDIDAALAEALEDEKAGRVSPAFQTAEEIEAWQKTDNYKKLIGKA